MQCPPPQSSIKQTKMNSNYYTVLKQFKKIYFYRFTEIPVRSLNLVSLFFLGMGVGWECSSHPLDTLTAPYLHISLYL